MHGGDSCCLSVRDEQGNTVSHLDRARQRPVTRSDDVRGWRRLFGTRCSDRNRDAVYLADANQAVEVYTRRLGHGTPGIFADSLRGTRAERP
jgi:hypothetical protein